ncbi:MAG TPA: hypothetical protein VKV26_12845 [Dehalococcoidia bacterium]|nr:hypothetical protein [Dehalococcoidia bacterium]
MDAYADALLAASAVAGTRQSAQAGPESQALLPRLVQFQCPRCLYLTPEESLIDCRRRCPHCKQPGERRLFPPPALLALCDLLRAVYASAARQGDHGRGFARAFRRRFRCSLSDAELLTLAGRVQASAAGGEGAPSQAELLDEVRHCLGLADEGEVRAAYGQLLLFSDTSPTGILVVLLADAVLQGMVREVLSARLLGGGMSREQATLRLSAVSDLSSLEHAFATITRRPLRQELSRVAETSFAQDWWALHARVTAATAGTGTPIRAAEAETAFRLVSESAVVISALANAVVVGKKPFHRRRPRA